MHAERDYLVKRVFPEIEEWCEERRIRLVAVDLRWGVTEEEAARNRDAVRICLQRIDQCRPFFVCLVGQRRGWIPAPEEISRESFTEYPGLTQLVGRLSVTEMEILHALDPLQQARTRPSRTRKGPPSPARRTLFYHRDPSYLGEVPPDVRAIYRPEGAGAEDYTRRIVGRLAARRAIEVRTYQVRWHSDASVPEGGLLSDFRWEGEPLSNVLVRDLRRAIGDEFPQHRETVPEEELQRELDPHEQFLFAHGEGYLTRGGEGLGGPDFAALDRYLRSDSGSLLLLTGEPGMGKSSLLARWLDLCRTGPEFESSGVAFLFRFIGAGGRAASVDGLLRSLLQELSERHGRIDGEMPADPRDLRDAFPGFLEEAGRKGKTVLVLDGLDQLDSGLRDLSWLPETLPPGAKVVVSWAVTKGGEGERVRDRLARGGRVILAEVRPFDDLEDRRRLAAATLWTSLKRLDNDMLAELVSFPGARNPLFLKVVLSELVVFGSFEELRERIRSAYGETPRSAFEGVLSRLEDERSGAPLDPGEVVPRLFGWLAHARRGLSVDELSRLLATHLDIGADRVETARDAVNLHVRQVRSFLARRGGLFGYFYESFREACRSRYVADPDRHVIVARSDTLRNACLYQIPELEGRHADLEEAVSVARQFAMKRGIQLVEDPAAIGTREFIHADLSGGQHPVVQSWTCPDERIYICKVGTNDPTRRRTQEWHAQLAEFFVRQDWRNPGDSRPNRRKIDELSWQQTQAETWSQLEETLCSLEFLETGCEAGMVHEILADYERAARRWPRSADERQEEEFRQRLFDGYYRDLARFAGDPEMRPLPQPPESISPTRTPEVSPEAFPGPRARVDAFRTFVESFVQEFNRFGRRRGFVLQQALGHADGGPVADAAEESIGGGKAPSLCFRILNRPRWNPHPFCRMKLRGPSSRIRAVALTADARRVLAGSEDGSLVLWDVLTGEHKRTSLGGRFRDLTALAMTPDGSLAVVGDELGSVHVLDVATGLIGKTLTGHEGRVACVALTPDGRLAASGGIDRTLRIWELATGRCHRELKAHRGIVASVALSVDGSVAASGGEPDPPYEDHSIRLWAVEAGKCLATLDGHPGGVSAVVLSVDGELVVSAGQDGTMRKWDAAAGSPLPPEIRAHQGGVRSIAVTPDKIRAVSGGGDRMVRVWSLPTGKCEGDLAGHVHEIEAVAIAPDASRGVSAGRDGVIRIWDLGRGTPSEGSPEHGAWVVDAAFVLDGKSAWTAGNDGTLRRWDTAGGKLLERCSLPGPTPFVVALSPDGRRVACRREFETIHIFDLQERRIRATLHGHRSPITSACFSRDGSVVVTGSDDTTLRVWSVEEGKCLRVLKGFQTYRTPRGLAVSPDGRYAYFAAFEGRHVLKRRDLGEGGVSITIDGELEEDLVGLACSGDGRLLAGRDTESLWIWDCATGARRLAWRPADHRGYPLLFWEEHRLLSGGEDGTLRVWDVRSGEMLSVLALTGGGVCTLAARGRVVVLGMASGEVVLLQEQ